MKKILSILICLLFQTILYAQELTEAEVTELLNSAFMQNQAGKHQEALEGFLKVGQNTKKQRTEPERQVYVCSQTMAVMCYEQLKKYQEGFTLSEQLLKEKLTGKEKEDILHLYVMNGYFMATSYIKSSNRRYADARAMFDKILPFADEDMRNRILPKIPLSWYFEGTVHQVLLQYEEALPCIEEAQKGFHKLGETKNEIDAICQLGNIKNAMFDTLGALEEYQKAGELAQGGNYDAKLMSILKEQRRLSSLIGNSEIAFKVAMQIDSLVALTDDQKIKFEYYSYKGGEAKDQGNFNLAEHWYLMNEQYVQKLNDEYIGADRHLFYTSLRDLYTKAGKYDDALKFAELSKLEFQRMNGPESNDYFMPYMSSAYIYRLKGDSIMCFAHLDTLFAAMDRLEEPKQKQYLYTTRAGCYSAFKNYELALADYKEADRQLATKYPIGDGDRIKLLALMGGMEHQLKHYDESERLYKEYADGMKMLHGENSDDYIDAVYYLANAEGFADHIDNACKHYTFSIEKTKTQIQEKLPYYTAIEREAYWNSKADLLRNTTAFAVKAEALQTDFTKDCYDALVLSKSFLLESERSTYDIVKSNVTEEDLHDMAMIAAMQAKIKDWERDYANNADSILEVATKADVLEKRLTGRCRSYGDMTSFMNIGYENVKDALNNTDVLIDFTDYVSESRGRVYAAYLVNKSQKHPLLKELFEECAIDSMKVPQPDMYYSDRYGKELYRLLWEPFKDSVKNGVTVYYVPSQLLFQIALESLPMEDGSLLGDHYTFVRLSSAREVVRNNARLNIDVAEMKTNAILYGGLKYDLGADVMKEESAKYNITPLLATRGDVLRGDSIYRELPETKKEIDGIESLLKSQRLVVTPYTGVSGTEESFLNMSGNAPQILHVATHGFYYTPDAAQKIDYLKGNTDAMTLSGLVMSGGNAAWLGKELPQGVLGGILTAANISRLDLSGIQMAVLSACQTGQGKATPEGLFGLQRAFKKAGVQTLVMSLWNVSDVVTKDFMIKFYENLAHGDWSKRKAFNDAKTFIRSKYADPYYWAGFVMLD